MNTPYAIPSTAGVTMAFGGGTLQSIYDGVLSYQAAAQAFASAIGATLLNAASTPALGGKFAGLGTGDVQPWVVQWTPGGPWAFAGVSVNQQVKANGGVLGPDGAWVQQHDGTFLWVPKPLTVTAPMPPPPPAAGATDADVWAKDVMGAGQGYLDGDRATLIDVRRLLVALAAKQGIS